DLLGRVVVGEEVLDPGEAGLGGSGETVHEVQLGKEHGEVGGKTWHGLLLCLYGQLVLHVVVRYHPRCCVVVDMLRDIHPTVAPCWPVRRVEDREASSTRLVTVASIQQRDRG